MTQTEPNEINSEHARLMASFTGDTEIDLLAQATSPMLAMALMEHFPGIELRIPHVKSVNADQFIAKKIGIEYATLLSFYGAGDTLLVPMKHPSAKNALWLRIVQMDAEGKSRRETALACGITQRSVRRILAGMGLTQKNTDPQARSRPQSPPESVFNGGLTGGLVDFGPYDPLPDPEPSQRASESKHGFYTPQPQKDQS